MGVLKVGDKVDRVVVVAKKVRREFPGGKFLLFQFTDRDGTLRGVLWDPPDPVADSIRTDDIVRVKGEIQEYQGSLQLKVGRIEKIEEGEYDPALFLPVSSRSVDEIYNDILQMISGVYDEHLRSLLETIFNNEMFKSNFLRAPAAKGWHHAYVGGLAEHIYDMARLAMKTADIYVEVDRDLLLAGVLLHDIGKIQELSVKNHIEYSDMGRLIGHIALGLEFLGDYMRGIDRFPEETAMRLKHMILSHHGSLENGSPVKPMTIEALLLHYIDNMDAQIKGALHVLEKDTRKSESWTEYVRLLDRFIYKGSGGENPAADDKKADTDG